MANTVVKTAVKAVANTVATVASKDFVAVRNTVEAAANTAFVTARNTVETKVSEEVATFSVARVLGYSLGLLLVVVLLVHFA